MIPLLASSVVAFTVIVERLFFWRRLRVQKGEPGILALVAEGDLPQAMQVASASFLNKEPTSLEALGQRVKDGLERDPELVVIINADD
jgi:hypothetical protein